MDSRLQRLRSDIERNRAYKFWKDANAWPFDSPDYIFLPRAIDALGKHLFANEWPSDVLDIRKSERLHDVILALREHCAFGRLIGAIQWHDGTFEPIPAEAWNTRDYEQWFDTDFKAPNTVTGKRGHPLATISECWLFIERQSFASVCSSQNDTSTAQLFHQSAYLKFLFFAAKQLDVGPDDARKAKRLANEIEDLAKGLDWVSISPNMAANMATILREPEAGMGKAAPNKIKSRDGAGA